MTAIAAQKGRWRAVQPSMVDAAGTVGARRPTWSDEVGRPCQLLAVGLAFVFVYAAASTVVDPAAYRSYLPTFLAAGPRWATDVALRLFAVYELALALGVLARRYRYRASLLSAVTLSGIVVVNVGAFDVLFRNVAIALGALALAGLTREESVGSHDSRPGEPLEELVAS